MPIQEVKDAVAAAIEETGFQAPQQGRDQPPAPSAAAGEGGAGDDDDLTPSAEELDEIDKDPQKKAVYRRLMHGFHGSNEKLAARAREAAEADQVVRAIRADPHAAIRAMAAATGVRLADEPAPQTLLQRTRAKLRAAIGDEAADMLAPVLNEVVGEIAGETIGPVAGVIQSAQAAAGAQAVSASVREFATQTVADGGDWDESIEQGMADLVPRFPPGRGVSLRDYLDVLYAHVTSQRRRAAPRRRVAVGEPKERIKVGMDNREAVRIAVAAARRESGR